MIEPGQDADAALFRRFTRRSRRTGRRQIQVRTTRALPDIRCMDMAFLIQLMLLNHIGIFRNTGNDMS